VPLLSLENALHIAQLAYPGSVSDVMLRLAGEFGGRDVVVYLVDFAQTTLEPLPDRSVHADLPVSEDVGTTMAGRAFSERRPATADRPDGVRVWVPILEGSDRTGVLALTVATATEEVVAACEALALLAGYVVAADARSTDLYNLHRRRRALSLPASMQWDLLPPLILNTERIAVAGLLEPAYDVGGDCFDYALNDTVLDLALFDPVGHRVSSALIAALAVGSYRHDRRENQSLESIHKHLDDLLIAEFPNLTFATGQIARVDLDTGTMTWTNAGHPPPILVRGGRVIRQLACTPTLPWGLGALAGASTVTTVATESLEPGDSVLFYTDGVIEAHQPGAEQFGPQRLADLTGRLASDLLEPEEIIRLLVQSVLEHRNDRLNDDATLVLFRWKGPPPSR
jgi:serine phosphatase RsbU (regulator of sigma subunit)